jgi:methionyl-tRNA formyltransferase
VPPLRLLFFGTPEIAVPTLERLVAGPHAVVGVVSQPDRARGRGRKTRPSPVSAVALREGIPLVRPERAGDDEALEAMRATRPDLGIVVAFGQFLPKKVRELPSRGYLINAHASLLPKYRGAAPIARAILEGERETGISVMRVEREMDAGPVALVRRTKIDRFENTESLSARLAEIAADAIEEAVDLVARDAIEWTEQDAALATEAPKLEKADAVLDLREAATALAGRVHALAPRPGATVRLVAAEGDGGADADGGTVLKILQADATPFEADESPAPGEIETGVEGVALRVATGGGWLVPLRVQRAGGKPLWIDDFLRGFELAPGTRAAVAAASADRSGALAADDTASRPGRAR